MNNTLPYIFLFSFTMFMGSLITLMSNQWIFLWIGLEINLLSIVPLMLSSSNMNESESCIKYFIIQAIGGALILLASISSSNSPMSIITPEFSSFLLLLGLLIKLGAAPVHFWFPQVMNGLNWPLCIILVTWQKIPPLMILTFLFTGKYYITILLLGILSIWVGGLGGLNQTQLRPLLAYSSISHLGWMLSLSFLSSMLTCIYLTIYILSSLPLMFLLMLTSNSSNSLIAQPVSTSPTYKMSLFLLLLNLGGIPPFLGFFPKLMTIYIFTTLNMPFIATMMVVGSLISLFYYLNLIFNSMMTSSYYLSNSNNKSQFPLYILSISALIPLPMFLFMI